MDESVVFPDQRPRDAEGRFLKASKLAKKVISARLLLESYDLFMEFAKEDGKSPTILVREILERYIADRQQNRNTAQTS
jgi:hypothetical protein